WYYCEWEQGPRLPSIYSSPHVATVEEEPDPDEQIGLPPPAPLGPTDCPLVREPSLVEQFNEVVRRWQSVAERPELFRQGGIQQLVASHTVRERLTRDRFHVGFLGALQVGKSATINSILDTHGEHSVTPVGSGAATSAMVARLRPQDAGDNTLTLRYL